MSVETSIWCIEADAISKNSDFHFHFRNRKENAKTGGKMDKMEH